ncbi:flavin reductase family protein [Amycolatopsis sp. NBC_00345]|uniref:flavin reductase family protein n=1 Tax=Amycolatopsis sp. NBC_00345 TaxID=2975955 RepID=UPI002E25560D
MSVSTDSTAGFREFMTHWPTGVTVVTSLDGGVPVGCTVNSIMSLSVRPPLLVVSLATDSETLAAIQVTGSFGLNVLSARQQLLCQRFAGQPQGDRFLGVETELVGSLPLLAGASASMVCRVQDELPYADHVLLIGAPEWESIAHDRTPLVLHQRGYHKVD